MTQQDFEILWMSRLRLVETEIFLGCRDRDSLRLRNFSDVETETHRDWENQWMSRPRPVETGQKMSIPRLHRDSRSSLVWVPRIYYAGEALQGIACSCDVVNLNGEESTLIMALYPVMDEYPERSRNRIYKGPSSRLTEVTLKGTQESIQELMSNWGLSFVNNLPFTLTADL